jgi:hypothetical protein
MGKLDVNNGDILICTLTSPLMSNLTSSRFLFLTTGDVITVIDNLQGDAKLCRYANDHITVMFEGEILSLNKLFLYEKRLVRL